MKHCLLTFSHQTYQLTWSKKLLPKLKYSVGYVANIDAVSLGPYTVRTPPLKSMIASEADAEEIIYGKH